MRSTAWAVLFTCAACGSRSTDEAADSSTVTSCSAPTIRAPTEGEATRTTVMLSVTAPSCIIAIKCYVNGDPTPVASSNTNALSASVGVPAGKDQVECNGWNSSGAVYKSSTISFVAAALAPDAGVAPDAGSMPPPDAGTIAFDIAIASLMAHNTSANPAYDQAHFPANFGTSTWISQSGATMSVDPSKQDLSLNPVTPAHVSNVDVHTLIPSRPDLRWFAHATPWFRAGGGGGHQDIGLNNDSPAYVASMLADMKRRGFDGVVINWYGQASYENAVTLLIQQALAADPNNKFTYVLMFDKGIPNLSQSTLETELRYCQSQFFGDRNYELEGSKPIVMFFGVEAAIGGTAMAAAKALTGGNMVWVTEGPSSLSNAWVDQCFDWTHDYHDGPSSTDPYNLSGVAGFYGSVSGSSKKAFGSMVAGFNGMLTNSVAWSKGKYLPRGDGACVVEWAKKIDAVIPRNVTRMQWATWSDWQEGTQIETGVENNATVRAQVGSGVLSWTVSAGTGDESTIDHYEAYATVDGVNGALLGTTRAHSLGLNLPSGPTYQLLVKAVGKPNIRDHMSATVSYTP
jgi:hypothetical protein